MFYRCFCHRPSHRRVLPFCLLGCHSTFPLFLFPFLSFFNVCRKIKVKHFLRSACTLYSLSSVGEDGMSRAFKGLYTSITCTGNLIPRRTGIATHLTPSKIFQTSRDHEIINIKIKFQMLQFIICKQFIKSSFK